MAELTALREENTRLQAEVAALNERLRRYEEREQSLNPYTIAAAIGRAWEDSYLKLPSDWIAAYWVLTTYAKAPTAMASFVQWVNDLPDMDGIREELGIPRCSADILYKANSIFFKPPHRWTECTTIHRTSMAERLKFARRLKYELVG